MYLSGDIALLDVNCFMEGLVLLGELGGKKFTIICLSPVFLLAKEDGFISSPVSQQGQHTSISNTP